jgi:Protein of unknown function (DUF1778)
MRHPWSIRPYPTLPALRQRTGRSRCCVSIRSRRPSQRAFFDSLLAALDEPPQPNAELRAAARRARDEVRQR